jgi:hypothetical protein
MVVYFMMMTGNLQVRELYKNHDKEYVDRIVYGNVEKLILQNL